LEAVGGCVRCLGVGQDGLFLFLFSGGAGLRVVFANKKIVLGGWGIGIFVWSE